MPVYKNTRSVRHNKFCDVIARRLGDEGGWKNLREKRWKIEVSEDEDEEDRCRGTKHLQPTYQWKRMESWYGLK